MKEKTLKSKLVFENDFMDLYVDDILLPDGKEATRTYIKHNGAAAVLPITKDGKLVLTKQYRYPVHKISIEIPAGKKDSKAETGLACVQREIEEETGYNSNHFEHIHDIHNCIAYSDEMIELFIAYDCDLVDNRLTPDEDEFIEPMVVSLQEVEEMIASNEITDLKTLYTISYYKGLLK
jgi:ADP-ribose pyrophosphatase